MKGIFLLLGTNLGDRLANLNQAKLLLESYPVLIVDYSKIYESAPWGDTDQGSFLNMILRVDTILDPHQLLEVCLEIEKRMGRERIKKWGERIIDIDILYYDNHVINDETLIIPHPGIQMRRFTLMPMVEIAPNEAHPLLGYTQLELLELCPDLLECSSTEMELEL
ncbi:MAG: 2-amino-4-hydroxy-6-hydroxymethyldihydropteridine diphosphokinase [Marinoscillum sp.]|jgi:2-amino-4-hydroxy-6-hydroxymethyldihydropteridine diphosphokinase